MAYQHSVDTNGQPTAPISGTIVTLNDLSDSEIVAHLATMGLTESLVEKALKAAQKVLDDAGVAAVVSQFAIEQAPPELADKCGCGSRCTSWGCEPYTRCYPNSNGGQTCVNGHRTICTGMSCNPC